MERSGLDISYTRLSLLYAKDISNCAILFWNGPSLVILATSVQWCESVTEIKEHKLFTASILATLYHFPPINLFLFLISRPFLKLIQNFISSWEVVLMTIFWNHQKKINWQLQRIFWKNAYWSKLPPCYKRPKWTLLINFWGVSHKNLLVIWIFLSGPLMLELKRTSTSCQWVILATHCHCNGSQRKSLAQKGC